jgi:hypothetical protein
VKIICDAFTGHFSAIPPYTETDGEYFKAARAEIDTGFEMNKRQFFYLEKICKLVRQTDLTPKIRTIRYESPTGHTGHEDNDEGQASHPATDTGKTS